MSSGLINGFSKLSKKEKISWLSEQLPGIAEETVRVIEDSWSTCINFQKTLDGFSENTIANYHLPYGLAPNFIINGQAYCVPMVIEESSVVAAASAAAKYWMDKGGFHAEVVNSKKIGQVHFYWTGDYPKLKQKFDDLRTHLLAAIDSISANMVKRGGGVLDIELLDMRATEPDYFQLFVSFDTCDSMGANFINSILERFAQTLCIWAKEQEDFTETEKQVNVIMAILSNYTPECLVRAWVECPIDQLGSYDELSAHDLADKFHKAIRIATIDPYRATTHNKGIFNGIDAVVLATGNDFRAVEACGHAYAARSGQYRSLSSCRIDENVFRFEIEIPLALGTVGGLTSLHPLAKLSLQILDNPSAQQLMQIIAVVGLAQNFGAVRSLVTSGIQKGHMKMHLGNIFQQLGASEAETQAGKIFFEDKTVSYSAVRDYLHHSRMQITA